MPGAEYRVGDYIVARLPHATAVFAAKRGYLPLAVPILKRVAAVHGQHVCVRESAVYVEGVAIAPVLKVDGSNRPLPPWLHCRPLLQDEVFLLNAGLPGSFDSRYFGPIDVSFIRGRAVRLATILK